MTDCDICSILESRDDGQDVQVCQTERWRIVLDTNQRTIGKAFVTLRAHKQSLAELDETDWLEFAQLVRDYEHSIRQVFQPSHFNWECLMNIAASDGRETHVHWHVLPRYQEPVEFAGESFSDVRWYPRGEKGDHPTSKLVLEQIAATIQENMSRG